MPLLREGGGVLVLTRQAEVCLGVHSADGPPGAGCAEMTEDTGEDVMRHLLVDL